MDNLICLEPASNEKSGINPHQTLDIMDENSPPPSASAFLQKHTHHSDSSDDGGVSSVGVGSATVIVSNIIEGLVGASTTGGGEDDTSSQTSMKHRKESSRPYDQRMPKMYNTDGDEIPFRGFGGGGGYATSSARDAPAPPARFARLRHNLRGLFSPRATDIQQLLNKLQTQFRALDLDFYKYALQHDGSMWDEGMNNASKAGKNSRSDPKHPLNNPKLLTELHFVGRQATNPAIVELTTLLTNYDKFGSITELWLNDNLISDDGAAAIASFLQLPTCALVELWLGNNQIGPSGTTLISASLSNNENSQLKCLGLYKNPIGNGGASTLAQMLRKNNMLSTLDIHACGRRSNGHQVLEGYGCKVVVVSDGTEYVASGDEEGVVTDQRLLDAIQTFVALNRINPTREQAIRGMMASNKHIQGDVVDNKRDDTDGHNHQSNVSKFLSELCKQPANEYLTDKEKLEWKDCEWERLHVELERARAAKSALTNQLQISPKNDGKVGEEEATVDEEEGGMERLVGRDGIVEKEEENVMTRDLDDEVVRTDSRSWRDLKMGITGSTKASSQLRKEPSSDQKLYVISDVENESDSAEDTPPPQSTLV